MIFVNQSSFMKTIALFLAVALAASPLFAQGRAAAAPAGAAEAEAAAPKTGVRFVIVAPDGGSLPSPLFCKQGKGYKEIKIGARTPSVRVKPEGGVVNFYKEDPTPATAGDKGAASAAAADKVKLPDPVLSISVPGGSSKMLCIVVPNKEGGKPQTFFLQEKDFPKKGVHIINFTSNKLVMSLSAKGDFSDKKDSVIGVFKRDAGITAENSWTFKGENDGDSMAFKLSYLPKDGKGEKDLKMLRASKFVVSSRQSQINIVVKSGGDREMLKLMPIQLMNDRGSSADE